MNYMLVLLYYPITHNMARERLNRLMDLMLSTGITRSAFTTCWHHHRFVSPRFMFQHPFFDLRLTHKTRQQLT
jgi:hypothetical protein